ncbi:Protein ECERIFERUM 16 [Cardamine amara subsp. amara]|uniref:Protein ECERIFERUM 16 n=1 Tax=Cardamine amara subsp. amara TaxID=228776 RepID=A0ABD1AIT5_CARAN
MDTKSLAKSKRAHTQHHNKKSHSVHKPKAPGVSENSKNPEKLKVNQTKSPVQSISALPSNWDRYNDDESEDLSISQHEDDVLPKSKGADYMHLISEAEAESQSRIEINSDCLSSLDDLLHDEFSRIVGSMISVRGEGIVSWMEDDNFIVEEDGSASYQEPGFLSLNLNALAKSLEKVDLHERLYIKADLLPLPELCTSQSKVSGDDENTEAKTTRLKEPLDQVKDIPILTDQSEKSSAIEADLDLLLSSFSKAHTQPNPMAIASSSSNHNLSVQKSSAFETELDSLLNSHSNAEPFNKPANPSDQKLHTTGFDDVLDDLLESTSVSIKPQQNQTTSSSSLGKSKVLDDFDSWLDTI